MNEQNENQNDIIQNLETVKKQGEILRDQIRVLEEQVKRNLARGTGDVTKQAKVASEMHTNSLASRIEVLLQKGPLSSSAIAKELGEQLPKVQSEMRALRNAKKVANAGTEASPRWNWKLDEKHASSKEIQNNILKLITGFPMSFAELVIATGIRGGMVQGALVEIRRSGTEIHNFGTKARARYFVMPPNPLDARLAPKPPGTKQKTPSNGVPVPSSEEEEMEGSS